MRVLHLTSSFPRSADDHVAPFLLDLCRAQVGAGTEVSVLAPHDPGLGADQVLGGVAVHRFRYAPARAETLAYRGGLLGRTRTAAGLAVLPLFLVCFTAASLREARRLRPDVLHAHWWFPAGVCALFASRLTRIPLVITLHGSDAQLLRRRWLRPVGLAVLRRAGAVSVVSEHLHAQLVALGLPPERLHVLRMPVHSGTGCSPLPPAPPVRLLAAGRLSPEKGFDVLIVALALAVERGLDLRLELVGSGPELARLERLAGPVGERVRLLPAEPRARLLRRMTEAHALVVPSRSEGLGLIALEALAQGRPVLASRVGGLPEAVADGEDGLLLPSDDPEALVGALARLPLPAPMGAALQRHAASAVARLHGELYRSVVTGSRT